MNMRAIILASATALCALAVPASAAPINWVTWNSSTNGQSNGTAQGSIATSPGINVSYTGEVDSLLLNYPSWNPNSTFNGTTLNAPPASGNSIQLMGGLTSTDTITFSAPVVNPYIAIWSLGQAGDTTSFNFNATPTLLSGGASAEYAGSSISIVGNDVFGTEGNGLIQFNGTFNSISWTNPVFENYYAFTVGIGAPSRTDVPEPLTLSLFGAGVAGAAVLRRRKAKKA